MNQPEIGKLIRELRLEIGLTQEKFAAALEIAYPMISRWENNRARRAALRVKTDNITRILNDGYGVKLVSDRFY